MQPEQPQFQRSTADLPIVTPATRLALSLALALPAIVGGAQRGSAAGDRERDLETIRTQIALLEAQLERVERDSVGLERELRRTELEIELHEERLAEVRWEQAEATASLERSEQSVLLAEARLDGARQALSARLVSLYRRDQRHVIKALVASEAPQDVLGDLRLLRLAAYGDAAAVDSYAAARDELAREVEMLTVRRREVEALARRERSRLARLEALRSAQRGALGILEARREGMAETASRLLAKEEKVAMLLEILSGREVVRPAGLAIAEFQGALDWPIRGPILRGFGPRLDERYRTRIPHNGIEIETPDGSPVAVVFPGVVVFSAPFEDFGLTIVVHHPVRVFSLYAGLEKALVEKGDVVSFSHILGYSRSSLYFEIRSENRPHDPITWLR